MLAVASNLFGRSSSFSAYTLHTTSSPSASSTNLPFTSTSSSSPSSSSKSFSVGLWRVLGATHKTTGKEVSVWVFEKKILDGIKGDSSGRNAVASREWVVEQLKKDVRPSCSCKSSLKKATPRQATSLSRLRHPDILHMVEPLDESRSELTFVTEIITASLQTMLTLGKHTRGTPPTVEVGEVDLDEVEIQKGTLQIAKGLAFLHQQARMVHLNLSPDAILINSKVCLVGSVGMAD
jgi:SCY1-like protein 2